MRSGNPEARFAEALAQTPLRTARVSSPDGRFAAYAEKTNGRIRIYHNETAGGARRVLCESASLPQFFFFGDTLLLFPEDGFAAVFDPRAASLRRYALPFPTLCGAERCEGGIRIYGALASLPAGEAACADFSSERELTARICRAARLFPDGRIEPEGCAFLPVSALHADWALAEPECGDLSNNDTGPAVCVVGGETWRRDPVWRLAERIMSQEGYSFVACAPDALRAFISAQAPHRPLFLLAAGADAAFALTAAAALPQISGVLCVSPLTDPVADAFLSPGASDAGDAFLRDPEEAARAWRRSPLGRARALRCPVLVFQLEYASFSVQTQCAALHAALLLNGGRCRLCRIGGAYGGALSAQSPAALQAYFGETLHFLQREGARA